MERLSSTDRIWENETQTGAEIQKGPWSCISGFPSFEGQKYLREHSICPEMCGNADQGHQAESAGCTFTGGTRTEI